jgi:hypothetical protein
MFANNLGMIDAIAQLGERATIGEIQKMNPHLTRGQVERLIKGLCTEKYVDFKTVAYGRTGKRIWFITDRCFTNMCTVAKIIWDRCNDEKAA